MFLHRATPVLNANVRAFNFFVQSLKSHKYILSLRGALSWPEKVNTDRFRKTGKEERVPQAQSGLQRVAGWASGSGTLQSLTGTQEPCPACFSSLMAAAAPPLASWGSHCSLARGRPWGSPLLVMGYTGGNLQPSADGWTPPPTPGTATSALGKWVRAGNRFFPHWVAASYPLSTRHAAAGPDFKVGAAEHSALSMGPFWAWDPVGLHWSCTHSAPGTGARTRKQEEARRYPPARPAPPTPTSKWGPSWPRGSPGKGRIILWTKAFSSLYYCPVGSIFPFYSSSCFLPT